MNTVKHYSVIIIGAGQAGLSMSYCMKTQDVDHIVLEKTDTIANAWRTQRWDAFCLVTPNWQCQLPGYPYQGNDPDGFMVKEEIIEYLDGYCASFKPPIVFNSAVTSLNKLGEKFHVQTKNEHYTADQIVLACGSYHEAKILPFAKNMPKHIQHVHSSDYKNETQLPEGEVMVIGTGQSGTQIAEDLHLEGRKVHLCVGTAPRVNRRYRGKDVVQWLDDMNYYQMTVKEHPDGKNAAHATNHYVTGRDGGRDLNLRIFAEEGMQLYGKLNSVNEGIVHFDNDLKHNLDYADDVAKRIVESIETYIQKNNIQAPVDNNIHSDYLPESPLMLDMNTHNITSVIWATGFNMKFDWVKLPIFDEQHAPLQNRGVTPIDGLYFLGLNWMNTWGSGRFYQVGRDAEFLSDKICAQRHMEALALA